MSINTKQKQILRLLFWESTIKCNLNCAHCRRIDSDEASERDITTSQAKNLIEQLSELGKSKPTMPVMVFSGGEPLCREDIFDLISYAKTKELIPALATNGTLIDSKTAGYLTNQEIGLDDKKIQELKETGECFSMPD